MSKNGMGEALAFAPGHITGFFEICDQPENLSHQGSRGAGICFNQGIVTQASIKPAKQNLITIYINGAKLNSASVSYDVAKTFLTKIKKPYNLAIEHKTDIPIGCGLGSSGAGALSLALALNKILLRKKTNTAAIQIAHVAEIKNKTGLGTVVAQSKGGLEIRKKSGGPGFGKIESLAINKNYRVVGIVLERMSTGRMLINQKIRERINENGEKALKRFLKRPSVNQFMEVSRDFAESIGLISSRLRKIIDITDKKGFLCSQAMFGETLFSIVRKSDASKLVEIFRQSSPLPHWIINAEIDNKGARLL
jgi:pantoate kinase